MRAFSSAVLPGPVPPETRMFRRDDRAVRAARRTAPGRAPCRTRSPAENARPPKPAYGDHDFAAGWRGGNGDPRSVAESGIEEGLGGGIELAASLDPDVPGSLDHDLGDLRVLEQQGPPAVLRAPLSWSSSIGW